MSRLVLIALMSSSAWSAPASCPDAWTAWTQDREDTKKAGDCVRICRVAGDDVSLAHARTCAESWWPGQRAALEAPPPPVEPPPPPGCEASWQAWRAEQDPGLRGACVQACRHEHSHDRRRRMCELRYSPSLPPSNDPNREALFAMARPPRQPWPNARPNPPWERTKRPAPKWVASGQKTPRRFKRGWLSCDGSSPASTPSARATSA